MHDVPKLGVKLSIILESSIVYIEVLRLFLKGKNEDVKNTYNVFKLLKPTKIEEGTSPVNETPCNNLHK